MPNSTVLKKLHMSREGLRKIAGELKKHDPFNDLSPEEIPESDCPIRVVCISDTHNFEPELPEGDLLIHAGDLTETGSFDEVQAQLKWLSSQPHQHKIVVAGNHDVILDEGFLQRYPWRRYGQTKTLRDLDWGDIHYLDDADITLDFNLLSTDGEKQHRRLTIYGNPITPRYGAYAFKGPRDQDIWRNRVKMGTDIVVAHGPPHLHLDGQGFGHAGSTFLAHEIARVRPRLVVFGHVHTSHGREDVVLNSVVQHHDDIIREWEGQFGLVRMFFRLSFVRLLCFIRSREAVLKDEKVTTFVNAAVVGDGAKRVLKHEPLVVQL